METLPPRRALAPPADIGNPCRAIEGTRKNKRKPWPTNENKAIEKQWEYSPPPLPRHYKGVAWPIIEKTMENNGTAAHLHHCQCTTKGSHGPPSQKRKPNEKQHTPPPTMHSTTSGNHGKPSKALEKQSDTMTHQRKQSKRKTMGKQPISTTANALQRGTIAHLRKRNN